MKPDTLPQKISKIGAEVVAFSLIVFSTAPTLTVQAQTIEEIQGQIVALQAQLAQLLAASGQGGVPPACVGINFGRNLAQGMSGNDVKCLQQILNTDPATQVAVFGPGSPGNETFFFGPLTRTAVIKFQEKYRIEILAPLGLFVGTGFVGPKTRDRLSIFLLPGGVGGPVPGVEENRIELALDTPPSSAVAKGARDVSFMKLLLSAGPVPYTVSQITLTRMGVSQDSDISAVRLFEGQNQIGSTQAINAVTHKVVFSNLNFQVPADSIRNLIVKADISSSAVTANTVRFTINAPSDIMASAAFEGDFPIIGSGMTVAGLSTGALMVSTVPSLGGTRIAGGGNQDVAMFRLAASGVEGLSLQSIILTEVGSSVDQDMSNIKLWSGSAQLGVSVPFLTDGRAIFDLSISPLLITAGGSKDLTVTVDVGTGLGINNRTIAFEITNDRDVVAYGSNSNGRVPVFGTSFDANLSVFPQRSASATIVLGSLTVSSASAFNPSVRDLVRGSSQVDLMAVRFTAGATEGVRLTQIRFQRGNAGLSDSDISNIALYDTESGSRLTDTAGNVISAVPIIGGVSTFGFNSQGLDNVGLLDIPAGSSRTILVKADVPSAAAVANSVFGLKINNPSSDVKADGLTSRNDLSSTEINGGITASIPILGSEILHSVVAKGSLALQVAANTSSASTFTLGTTEFEFAKFNFVATGEPIVISQLAVLFAKDSSAALTTDLAAPGDISNVKLFEGSTLLAQGTLISGGKSFFSLNTTIPANSFKTLTVKADIPISSTANFLHAHVNSAADVSGAGQFSGQTIAATAPDFAAVHGNLMQKGAPTLTVRASPVPASQTIAQGAADATLVSLFLTASLAEDARVSKIKIIVSATADSAVSDFDNIFVGQTLTEPIASLMGNVKLFVDGVQIGNTVPRLTVGTAAGTAEFSGLNLIVPRGGTKIVDVKASIFGSSALNIFAGMSSDTSNVSATGRQSGQAVTVVIGSGQGTGGNSVVLSDSGSMTASRDAGMPVSSQVLAGASDVTFGRWKLAPSSEGVKISKLIFDMKHSSAAVGRSLGRADSVTSLAAASTPASFNYSINAGAVQTCTISSGVDLASGAAIASEITADCPDLTATFNSAADRFEIEPVAGISLQITDFTAVSDQNIADDLKLGLKYGGTESVGTNAGSDANIRLAKLYDGNTLLAIALPGAEIAGKIIFNFTAGTELIIPLPTAVGRILSLRIDLSDYTNAVEGSTLAFAIGAPSVDFAGNYIAARGVNSGAALTVSDITNLTGSTAEELASNPMLIYASKPVVEAPDVIQPQVRSGASEEVFRFTVTTSDTGHDIFVNAIRFTIGTNAGAGTTVFGRTFRLYRSTDFTTVLAEAQSNADNINTDSTGWVAMYPATPIAVANNSSATFVLKADTSAINTNSSTVQPLVISIEAGDFYWSDGQALNARDRIMNLPITGRLLQF